MGNGKGSAILNRHRGTFLEFEAMQHWQVFHLILENHTRPSTLSTGACLVRRAPGMAVSEDFLACAVSDCRLG